MSFLFGRGARARTRVTSALTKDQRRLLDEYTSMIRSGLAEEVTPYGGQITPGASKMQKEAFGKIQELMDKQRGFGIAKSAISDILSEYDPEAAKQAWERGVYDPAKMRLLEETIPGIMEGYVAGGGSRSGAAGRALAKAGAQFETEMAGTLSQILYEGEQAHETRRQAGISQALQQQQMEQTAAELGLAAGEVQRGISSEKLQEQYQKWLQKQPYGSPWLQQIPTALGVSPYDITTVAFPGTSGFLGGILGKYLGAQMR
ncbi:MAG TPA: hypothetical protein EYP60_04875 [bacterium (Candidatus Stahlbacteria)]|nr:hypothetical protein [Candidatus Stahlbacteria bacterium]